MLFDFWFCQFWLLCGLWVGGGYRWAWKSRAAAMNNDACLRDQMNRWARGWFLSMMIPSSLLWLIQLSAGLCDPTRFVQWPIPQYWWGMVVIFACWTKLLGWVLVGDGAQTISRMNRVAQSDQPLALTNLTAIRLLTTTTVFVGLASILPSIIDKIGFE